MKRLLFIFSLSVFLLSSFSSCKKCYVCDFGNGDVRELCSKDFPDGTSGLEITVDAYEKQGYQCTEK